MNMLGYGKTSVGGFLKTMFRKGKDGFTVDFENDFFELGNSNDGFVKHFYNKMRLLYDTIKNLFIIMSCCIAICKAILHGLQK